MTTRSRATRSCGVSPVRARAPCWCTWRTPESTATTFTDTGVTAGVKHVYRVKAINAAGLSGWSNYVNPTP